ncbi:integrase, catalytic region, zinc finger, CCHC-type containing protein [Tanacetum coccineum]|uniref:Integrase, catalytic region, zinc finger, CCHC-type containing protein n=1 Tax=Tanacetum coccineum TaxID=301880 RepID=A0ABQ4ZQM5_9ASTR
MSNQSEDIQATGSDTRPPMLDKTGFESWQQRIWLYCKGKHHGPERDRVVADLSQAKKDRLRADICATNILLQGLPRDIYKLINHNTDAKYIWDNGRFMTAVKLSRGLKESNHDQLYAYLKQHELHANENKMLMERLNQHSHDPLTLVFNVSHYQYPSSSSVPPQPSYIPPYIAGNANAGPEKPIKCYNCNRTGHIARNYIQPKRPQMSDYFKKKMLLMQAQENGVDLDEEHLLFLAGGQTNTFDDETMFMVNLSFADPAYDEAGLSAIQSSDEEAGSIEVDIMIYI